MLDKKQHFRFSDAVSFPRHPRLKVAELKNRPTAKWACVGRSAQH